MGALRENQTGDATIFKLDSESFINRGVDLRFCSAFPEEREYLYPPCTYLMPTHKKQRLEVRRMPSGLSGAQWRVTRVKANAVHERLKRASEKVKEGLGVSPSTRSSRKQGCIFLDVIEVKPNFPAGGGG